MTAAFNNFWRNIWLTLATMMIMTITLLVVMFLYFANVFGLEVIKNIEQKVDLSITFVDGASEESIVRLADEYEARQDVEAVQIVTSEQALEIFRQRNQDKPFIEESLKELENNPLPASLFIVASEPRFYAQISQELKAEKYSGLIMEVNYDDSQQVIERLISVISTIKSVGLVMTLIFAALVVLIMFNTVRLAIYSFREEIDIMHLVGASRWFIRGPFVLESILVAILSVILASAIVYPTLRGASPHLQQFFFAGYAQASPFDIYTFAAANWFNVISLQLLVAVGLAIFGSLIALQRYLKT